MFVRKGARVTEAKHCAIKTLKSKLRIFFQIFSGNGKSW